MNVNDAFPSRYLKAADLGESQPVVTIDRVEMADVGQGNDKERKPIVYFRGKDKGLVLNKTNANMITKLLGTPNTDQWTGQRIKLIAVEVEFQGDLTPAVRVRAAGPTNGNGHAPMAAPKPKPVEHAPVEAPSDDDIPF